MQVSVLGCGWLGLPLARALITQGIKIKGSTTTPGKIVLLEETGITPFIIDLDNLNMQEVSGFLRGSEILIINVPPKLRSGNGSNYPDKFEKLLPEIEKAGIAKVLFVSSTSVYADDNSFVTEDTIPLPDTESGKQLLATEQQLHANPNFKTTILRFAGLIGAGRHPVKFLAGKENIANPHAPVNLIHQEDCIGIILAIIKKDIWQETFNAAFPLHTTREVYYTNKALEEGLPVPLFKHDEASSGKTIVPHKLVKTLGYSFITPI